MKRVANLLLPQDRRALFIQKFRKLPASTCSVKSRKRLIALALTLALLIAITPPVPRAHDVIVPQSVVANQPLTTTWLPNLNVSNSIRSLVNWLAGKVNRKSPDRVTPRVNAYLTPLPLVLDAPGNLTVTSASSSSIALSWTAPPGSVDHYQIERSPKINGPFLVIANTSNTTYPDNGVTSGNAYLYRVRAIGTSGGFSTPSNMALGAAFSFGALQGQIVAKQHIYDLRTAVNAVRLVANKTAASWAIPDLNGALVQASVVQELRDQLDDALQTLSINAGGYDDPTLATGSNGTLIKAIHLEQLQTRATRSSSSSPGPVDTDTSTARTDPRNATGGGSDNPLSRNFNWTVPLVSLPGRAGMDLSLSLSYNSLVWTKLSTNYISFDDDHGFPSPGFRLGFPVIQPLYSNSEVGKDAYLLIGNDGSRTELRRVGVSGLFESADSSHLLLDTTLTLPAPDTGKFVLWTTDGTKMWYELVGSDYQCTQIKDRNGNFITVNYLNGRIDTVTDTVNRQIKFEYNATNQLDKITQVWKQGTANQRTQTWASFAYTDITFQTAFTNLTVLGPANGLARKLLSKVTLADTSSTPSNNSRFEFSYTSWGQIWKISNLDADNHLNNYRSYDLPQTGSPAQVDCPRFTERRDWAANWNRSGAPAAGYMLPTGTEQEVLTTFAIPNVNEDDTWTMPDNTNQTGTRTQVTVADGTPQEVTNEIYFIGQKGSATSGWRRSLPALVKTYDSNGQLQRQVMTTWKQDNEGVSYILNPRVEETNTYDPANNRKRVRMEYATVDLGNGTSCMLPSNTFEYQSNATTVLRRTHTEYQPDAAYKTRRILALPKEKTLYEVKPDLTEKLMSRVEFYCDGNAIEGASDPAAIQHDNTYFGVSFVLGRGNLTSLRRYDVDNQQQFTSRTIKYNRTGGLVSVTDADTHEITVSYTDAFAADSDPLDTARSFTTLAYPTTVNDANGFSTKFRYNYDFGAKTWQQTPQPNVTTNTAGPVQTFSYDVIGRLARTTSLTNSAFTRYNYGPNYVETFSSINTTVETANEGHVLQVFDGLGRVIARATAHPGSSTENGFAAVLILYDQVGRPQKRSNPTETSITVSGATLDPAQFVPQGDDAVGNGGWKYVEQTYDWKGRPMVSTNQDGTVKSASYTGCGCAGGEVVTFTDEVNRRRKLYSDALGREWKTEILNWDGTVYSTSVSVFNVRDQITRIKQYAGVAAGDASSTNEAASCPTGTCQETSMTFDGYARLQTQHTPEQNAGTSTSYAYNLDDTLSSSTDARGAVTSYGYNSRHLVTSVNTVLSGLSAIDVTYGYDAAGNATSMLHKIGGVTKDSASYSYDQLSRMTSESVTLNDLQNNAPNFGNYTIAYEYTLSDQVKKVTDPFNSPTDITYDEIGRTKAVTGTWNGTNYTYVNNVAYRAWGAVKSLSSGATTTYNSRMLPTHYGGYDYTYYDDGKLKEFRDQSDQIGDPHFVQFHYMSRRYSYDQVGRVTSVGQLENYSVIPPFTGGYVYDVFDNLTSRTGSYALNPTQSDSGSYTNDRRAGWTYNAEGKVTNSTDNSDSAGSSTRAWTYDAVGQLTFTSEVRNGQTATLATGYDGDGKVNHEIVNGSTGDYLIHSSVLGTVLTKLKVNGGKDITYVPTNGLAAPMQMQDQQFSSPASYLTSVSRDPLGIQENGSAYDPFGNLVANVQPQIGGPPGYTPTYGPPYGWIANSFTNANNLAAGCNVQGAPMDCNSAMIATMGLAFAANLPGAHLDMALAEEQYSQSVTAAFAAADQRKKQRTPPRLRPTSPKERQRRKKIKKKKGLNPYKVKDEGQQNVGVDVGAGEGIFRKRVFSNPLATMQADDESRSGGIAPCQDEEEAVFDKVAEAFGGTFNDYVDANGDQAYRWEFHIAPQNEQTMIDTMSNLGFQQFTNWNPIHHRMTHFFGYGSYHWEGNVRGNWYHFEFRLSDGKYMLPGLDDEGKPHYEPGRPSSGTHGIARGRRDTCQ